MDIEWQTLLKNRAAKVLFSGRNGSSSRALARSCGVDTRWARVWKPDDSKLSGRRAEARLIIKGFTDPDLIDIGTHSRTLTQKGL